LTKLKAGTVAKSILRRVVHPAHIAKAANLHRTRKANRRKFDDLQLTLYSEILPAGFLHYGYFEDEHRRPEDISFNDLLAAQHRYAELVVEQIQNCESPVLDVGCGMGGLCRVMKEQGLTPVALTPDRMQASHVRKLYPDVPVVHAKFEKIPLEAHRARYGTVITAESFQYLQLDKAMPLLDAVLKPGGRWIVCDYFKRAPSDDRTCHEWSAFTDRLTSDGWRIVSERDITRSVLPTLRFVHMWANRFGLPLMQFVLLRLRKKQPAVHYILEDALGLLQNFIDENMKLIDPEEFSQRRKYMFLVIERA
jgi:cyclopropane fatty-acyl-phospholipid synthase-like methyltransferase